MKTFLRALAFSLVIVTAVAPAAAAQAPSLEGQPGGFQAAAAAPQAAAAPAIPAAAGILVDGGDGKVLWSKQDRAIRAPASLTKILTALVVLENADLNAMATITPEARSVPGSRTYAEQGWNFTVRDLLWGMMLKSGNDFSIALAQKVSGDGSIATFMRMANDRAAGLGATKTHFVNPHGLDEPGHVTTARDLGLITMAALNNPIFAEMVASRHHQVPWGDGKPRTFTNHNKLLTRYPGTIGVKTGFTSQAGRSLVSAVRRDNSTLIAVTLGSVDHYAESIALYDWGFSNLSALRQQSTDLLQPAIPEVPPPSAPAGPGLIDQVLETLRSIGNTQTATAPSSWQGTFAAFALGVSASIGFFGLFLMRFRRAAHIPSTSWTNDPISPADSLPDSFPYVTRV